MVKVFALLVLTVTCIIVEAQDCPLRFLKNVDVLYTKDAASKPSNHITEMSGCNADLNAGFGGQFVWLIPEWTTKKEEAITSIEMFQQTTATTTKDLKDLAAGAGGTYRYLKMVKDTSKERRIVGLGLVRIQSNGTAMSNPADFGWKGCTVDINVNRKGDYLYLCWNSAKI